MVFLKKLDKVKKASGQILACYEIFEKDPSKVKTFGIVCTYKSKFGYHNMCKEVRSTSLNGAVAKLNMKQKEDKLDKLLNIIFNSHYCIKELGQSQHSEKYSDHQDLFFLLKKLIIFFIYQNKNYKIKFLLFFFNSFLLIY